MTIALTISPVSPLAGEEVTLTATGTVGNVQTFSLTAIPDESALTLGLLVDSAGDTTDVFTPDVPGAYTFTVYDYRRFSASARYPGDPAGAARSVLAGVQTGLIVYTADLVDFPIRTLLGYGATLRLTVQNDTIISGEFVDPLEEVGRTAALDPTLVGLLTSSLANSSASVAALDTGITDLRTKYEAHRGLTAGSVHAGADATNAVALQPPYSNRSARDTLNDLHDKLLGHMTGASVWHYSAGDTKNLPLVGKAATDAEAYVLSVDLRFRVYDLHRSQILAPASHGAVDSTNTLTAPTPLELVILEYLKVLKNNSPTIPAGEQTGVLNLGRRLGLRPRR